MSFLRGLVEPTITVLEIPSYIYGGVMQYLTGDDNKLIGFGLYEKFDLKNMKDKSGYALGIFAGLATAAGCLYSSPETVARYSAFVSGLEIFVDAITRLNGPRGDDFLSKNIHKDEFADISNRVNRYPAKIEPVHRIERIKKI
ncbi:MAG: hypothetical protein U9R08_00610 [Nanoarchaeota archaeon]|nr:hypothetical protein [Nanoarchaeota archaeon]